MNFNVRDESHKTPDQLEREIDMRREHIVDTLDELGNRLSPRYMVDQTVNYVRGNAGVFSRNLSSTVSHNTGPLLLTAAGLLWMFSNLRGRRHADTGYGSNQGYSEPNQSYTDQDFFGEYDYGVFDEYSDPTMLDVDESIGSSALSSRGTPGERSRKEQLKDKARGVKDKMAGAANEARHKFDSAKAKARQKAAQMRHGNGRQAIREQSQRIAGEFGHMVERHPLAIGAAGVVLGALIAASFAPTRTEDRVMGRTRDRMKDQASVRAREAGEKAEAKARETAAKVQEDIRQSIKPDSSSSPYIR